MVLFKSPPAEANAEGCTPFMFWAQPMLQPLLVIIAVLCIPIMLFAKPIMIMRARKEQVVSD